MNQIKNKYEPKKKYVTKVTKGLEKQSIKNEIIEK